MHAGYPSAKADGNDVCAFVAGNGDNSLVNGDNSLVNGASVHVHGREHHRERN
ncbi:MAG: hypothetical protein JWQ85_1846 [Mucilaginibacter sp.]|nr:hypothetical protein [Mucilaginibacter sp.]